MKTLYLDYRPADLNKFFVLICSFHPAELTNIYKAQLQGIDLGQKIATFKLAAKYDLKGQLASPTTDKQPTCTADLQTGRLVACSLKNFNPDDLEVVWFISRNRTWLMAEDFVNMRKKAPHQQYVTHNSLFLEEFMQRNFIPQPTSYIYHQRGEDVQKQEVFLFLDDLRESGETNMFGAVPYLLEVFPDLPQRQAKELLMDWMQTFSARHPRG